MNQNFYMGANIPIEIQLLNFTIFKWSYVSYNLPKSLPLSQAFFFFLGEAFFGADLDGGFAVLGL